MKKWFKKVLITGLTLTMMLGGTTAAFAHGKGGEDGGGWKWNKHQKSNITINMNFSDMSQAQWAMKYIASLASKQVFKGYTDGTFRPLKPVSRIEAITAAVRLLGLEDKAKAEMNTQLNFKDANLIEHKYAWAVGYVAVAAENDLFSTSAVAVQPNKPATRLWATTLLIKALKLQDEAKAKMNTQLTFRDARAIPAGSVGYVAEAVDKGLINGYNDGTFKPFKPVTRAELATLLDRTNNQMPSDQTGTVSGTVVSVNNGILTLTTDQGQRLQLTLDPGTFIYSGNTRATVSDLKPGDQVVTRSYQNIVVFIQILNSTSQSASIQGKVLTPVANNTLTILANDSTVKTLTLASNVLVYNSSNQLVATSSLNAGDTVLVTQSNNQVTSIKLVSSSQTQSGNIIGIVTAPVSNGMITVYADGKNTQYVLATNATFTNGSQAIQASDIKVGDHVVLVVINNIVSSVSVVSDTSQSTAFTIDGLFLSDTLNAQGHITTISVTESVYQKTYNVSSDVNITGNASLLTPNHPIELKGENEVVNQITIQ